MILFIWQKTLTEKISYSVSFTYPFSYLCNAAFLGQHQKLILGVWQGFRLCAHQTN